MGGRKPQRIYCQTAGCYHNLMVHLWARTGAQGKERVHVGWYCWRCATLTPADGVAVASGDGTVIMAARSAHPTRRARAGTPP